ncbi:phenylalanyl-tRNA synthetase subunit alpha [Candidatus Desulfofervidus auxilii]|uniref:Phenylalanine--tRNA ligase alpha subunit n=1 Tax=Desulfofervidus auxilii TaxID=1621989 RepID=A0A7U4TGS0_DESA2|nr:phenylalanine--tRNA ligase subunit alpha [Candidatus Desulfofervidus auxilii]AMM41024.1 phenylalanyl-tRNA synthetase subunit alpha [Candidatus Desulfofervidus auxilii]
MIISVEELEALEREALRLIETASSQEDLESIKIKFLGRKGKLTQILRGVKELPPEKRPIIGKRANEIKQKLEEELKKAFSAQVVFVEGAAALDVTLPGRRAHTFGTLHPITQVLQEICEIFLQMGFEIAEGPDVEFDYYNFEALNIPPHHPARDMQDTFYISNNVVLRTHTSSIQIRVMEKKSPPLRIIAPGAVYRCDVDIKHTPMFHQVEGLLVDKNVSFSQLKGILTAFMEAIFWKGIGVRFRPSFFPFTEPSAEMDIACVICGGKGCRICEYTGWLEILGCGMVHPAVFEKVGYDPETYTGFAFGLGVERIVMLKYGIDDIRLFFENDLRFLRQF